MSKMIEWNHNNQVSQHWPFSGLEGILKSKAINASFSQLPLSLSMEYHSGRNHNTSGLEYFKTSFLGH